MTEPAWSRRRMLLTYAVAISLLGPTLVIAFLRLDTASLGDGLFEFAVAERVLAGERLYRDVVVLYGPLVVYGHALLLHLVPESVVAVQVATLLSCVALVSLLAWVVYRETDGAHALVLLFVCAALYSGVFHFPRAGYSWGAVLLVTIAIVIARPSVSLPGARTPGRWTAVGILVGTAAGAKFSIAMVALAGFLAWIAVEELDACRGAFRGMVRRAGALTIGVIAVAVIVLFALSRHLTSGDMEAFLERSRVYTAQRSFSFFNNFGGPASLRHLANWPLEQVVLIVLLGGVAVSIVLLATSFLPSWVELWSGPGERRQAVARLVRFWAITYLISFAWVFPRADYPHVTFTIPVCFAALAIVTARVTPSRLRPLLSHTAMVGCLVYAVVMAGFIGDSAIALMTGRLVVFREYPGRGMLMAATFAR